MKKILFATTALIATGSVAAADVTFSGYGRFGAGYVEGATKVVTPAVPAVPAMGPTAGPDGLDGTDDDTAATAAVAAVPAVTEKDETNLISRLRLQIDMTAESDNGLSFSARYRIQAEEGGTAVVNGARFNVSAGGLTVSAGNICGAIECMPGLYNFGRSAGTGLEGNGFHSLVTHTVAKGYNWDFYQSGGPGVNGVEVSYSANGFGVHVSASEGDTGAHLSYSTGDLTLAVGMVASDDDTRDKSVLTVGYNFGNFNIGAGFADNDGVSKWNLKANASVGAATNVYGWVAQEDDQDMAYGLGVGHDMGGGTSIEAGVVSTPAGTLRADAGLLFTF